jgi:hypothetical protein
MASLRHRGTPLLLTVVCAAALVGCTTTGDGSAPPSPAATSDQTATEAPGVTDAAGDPFPDPDVSASSTCGQVSAYVTVISNALIELDVGVLDETGYRARLQGATEPLSNLDSSDRDVSAALADLSALARATDALDPTSASYDDARRAISEACAAAGSPIVISASSAAGG